MGKTARQLSLSATIKYQKRVIQNIDFDTPSQTANLSGYFPAFEYFL